MASLPAASFRELIAGVPVIRDNLFKHLVTLVRSLTGRVVEQSTLVVRQRVHTELLRLALEEPMADGVVCLKPAPNIEEMANRIGARREGVNRIVSELKEEGILERRGRALVVLDLDRLRSKVQSAIGE